MDACACVYGLGKIACGGGGGGGFLMKQVFLMWRIVDLQALQNLYGDCE